MSVKTICLVTMAFTLKRLFLNDKSVIDTVELYKDITLRVRLVDIVLVSANKAVVVVIKLVYIGNIHNLAYYLHQVSCLK
jgi:hypothetical protein